MNVGLMRAEISKVYNNNEWKARVTMMSDSQIIAVYNKFLKNDRFKSPTSKAPEVRVEARQLTFDDIPRGGMFK